MASTGALASVTMLGTRVVYSGGVNEQALRFTNPDDHPNLVQVWVDRGNSAAGMDNGEPQFIVSPPVFRMEANSGQLVRLSYVGDPLPDDRESLFFLNFVQVPALKNTSADFNQLVLTVRSRMKVFYRPPGLASDADASIARQSLSFSMEKTSTGSKVVARNDSGYYVVVQRAEVEMDGHAIEVARATMIPPRQEVSWVLPPAPAGSGKRRLKLKIVNDFGGDVEQEYVVQ
ncbi:P pilus assembly protein, chaperone PapD [Herbaspirillum sp. CF444]|nr:P pilus assembly protein, chaperone PapD [Herbaspirillum sp. CF444]